MNPRPVWATSLPGMKAYITNCSIWEVKAQLWTNDTVPRDQAQGSGYAGPSGAGAPIPNLGFFLSVDSSFRQVDT